MQGLGISKRWRLLGFVAIIAAILSISAIACGSDDEGGGDPTATEEPSATVADDTPEPGVAGQLDITALEYSYENLPASQPGGLTTITLDNIGGEDHQAQFLKLNEGVTFEQLQAAAEVDDGGASALAISTVAGGVTVTAPGSSGTVTHNLDEGTYAMLCFVSGADDVLHLAKGMISELEVTAPAAEQPEAPTADAQIAAADFAFTGDLTLSAGEQTVQVTNNGPQAHEMEVVKLVEGFTVEQLIASFTEEEPTPDPSATAEEEGPPPFTFSGGLGAIPVSGTGYVLLNLEAGNYALLCFVPDQATGAPHVALGMVTALTVE